MFATQINWTDDYKIALEKSNSTNKPILMLIDSLGCLYCELLEEEVLSNEMVSDFINENFIPLKVNKNNKTYPKENFTIYGTPTTFFINKNGKPYLSAITGYVKKDKYFHYLKIGIDFERNKK
jgi:thioredoxin-related protein